MYHHLMPDVRQEPEIALALAEARIAWALNHPHLSDWLKAALRTTTGLDQIAIQKEIELLGQLIAQRARAEVDIALSRATNGESPLSPQTE